MEKMRMETSDLTAANVEKIGALFPNCVTETTDENGKLKKAINFDLLRQMLSADVVEGDEAYEFTWVGKKAAIVEANKPIRKTLRPCPEESVDWDTTENLYIEGDNLEVLKLLQESYLGKIKMIYIDPPYNTGADFIYRDDFAQDSDEYTDQLGMFDENDNRLFKNTDSNGRFHSDWCSMIYSRLLLARNLLAKDGIIVISIGYQEYDNLLQMCKELFGNKQVIGVTVQTSGGKPSGGFNFLHEYLIWIVPADFSANAVSSWGGRDRSPFEGLTLSTFDKTQRPNQTYPIFVSETDGTFVGVGKSLQELIDEGEYVGAKSDYPYDYSVAPQGTVAVWPVTSKGKQCVWRQIPSRIKSDWEKGYIKITPNHGEGNDNKYSIQYLPSGVIQKVEQGKLQVIGHEAGCPTLIFGENQTVGGQVPTIWNQKSFFTVNGTQALKDCFPEVAKVFDYPKPIALLSDVLQATTSDTDIVLDFFSGSGTTAHTLMKLNSEDNMKRRFILVQLPEQTVVNSDAYKMGYMTICDVGKERIRRAGLKIKEDSPLTTIDLDTGFRVFKLDSSNMNDVYYAAGDYTQDLLTMLKSNVKSDRTDLDLLFGCLLEWGLPLSMPYKSEKIEGCTVHTYNDGDLIACFDENIPDTVIKEIAWRQPLRAVFRDSSFNDSPAKINVGEIFKMLAPDTRVKVI